jgi:cytochrome oxidase Cu insertion factor (SCO1/SenC/PrrC family)
MRTLILIAILAASAFAQGPGAQLGSQVSFAAIAIDGTKIDTADLRGKVVAVNLWFINCPNCVVSKAST